MRINYQLVFVFVIPINLFCMSSEDKNKQETITILKLNFYEMSECCFDNLIDEMIRLKKVNVIDKLGTSLLYCAARRQNENWVEKLLKARANPNIRNTNNTEQTPLFASCDIENSNNITQLLLDYGADINATSFLNRTVLCEACGCHNIGLVKFLLNYKKKTININAQDDDGKTALFFAIAYGLDIQIIYLLLRYGLDIRIVDNNGKIALDYIKSSRDREKIMKIWQIFHPPEATIELTTLKNFIVKYLKSLRKLYEKS